MGETVCGGCTQGPDASAVIEECQNGISSGTDGVVGGVSVCPERSACSFTPYEEFREMTHLFRLAGVKI